MAATYPNLTALRQGYAREPDRIAAGWNTWSENRHADGTTHVRIMLRDGTVHTWDDTPGIATFSQAA